MKRILNYSLFENITGKEYVSALKALKGLKKQNPEAYSKISLNLKDLILSNQDITVDQMIFLDSGCNRSKWTYSKEKKTVNVKGGFTFPEGYKDFIGIKFGYVSGDFVISHQEGLTSLEGSPEKLGGSLYLHNLKIDNLNGSPRYIGGDISVSKCNLRTLDGIPDKIVGSIYLDENLLTSLEGSPKVVNSDFSCMYNKITSLIGSPQYVCGSFYITGNDDITSLEGMPEYIHGGLFERDYTPLENISDSTIKYIQNNLRKGMSYFDSLGAAWKKISGKDKLIIYNKGIKQITPEEHRKYSALTRYERGKNLI